MNVTPANPNSEDSSVSDFPGPSLLDLRKDPTDPPDPEDIPSVDITSHSNGAELSGSRNGIGDNITLEVTGGEASEVSVTVQYSEGGGGIYQANRISPAGENPNRWAVNIQFIKSGKAFLVGNATIPKGNISSQLVNIVIAPTQQSPIAVTLNSSPAKGTRIKIPVSGAMIQILATIASPTKQVEFLSSLDNYSIGTPLIRQADGTWSASWSIAATGEQILLVRDYDFFNERRESRYDITLIDFTAPTITVDEPREDQEFFLQENQQTRDILVTGFIDDGGQSGYKAGTLTYTFNGKIDNVEPDANGRFQFVLPSVGSGVSKRVILKASDQSENATEFKREFSVASKYVPKTIDELLNQRSYLADLIRFATSHLLDNDAQNDAQLVSSSLLSQMFTPKQSAGVDDFFGVLSDPGSVVGERIINELLPVVSLLRMQLPGLKVHFAFESEDGQETPDSGPARSSASLSRSGLIGKSGATAGALELDEKAYAVGNKSVTALLSDLGKDNTDFSVSFWIYVDSPGIGSWRTVIYKGHEDPAPFPLPGNSNRTFGIFMYPDSNTLHYRIGTVKDPNEGGDSAQQIPQNQWTHVAYVKRGNVLELFLNGTKDSSASLSGDVVANSDDLYINKSPIFAGFRGALDDVLIYGFALSVEAIRQLSQSRSRQVANQNPLTAYVLSAYESLLVAHGTSYEELRVLPDKGSIQRRAIAERLGLTAPNANDDGLDLLLLPPSSVDLEEWLSGTFGLPSARELVPITTNPAWRGELLAARQNYLSRRWQAEDAVNVSNRPLLDPDLVEPEDLNSASPEALNILQQRSTILQDQWIAVGSQSTVLAALQLVYKEKLKNVSETLQSIENAGQAGKSIVGLLQRLGLTFSGFRRLRFYQQLQQPLSVREKEDLSHLLTQAWKLFAKYPGWVREEQNLTSLLWPSRYNGSAFITGHYKRDFLPWRGNVAERIAFEKLVASRLGAFDALVIANEQAVLDAQKTSLPLLRDNLLAISDRPSNDDISDELTERLLVDVASTGKLTRSLIDYAVLTLQRLINGIRMRRFEAGHPAAKWTLKTDWNDNSKSDSSFVFFDEEWSWMGSYGSWRSAKMAYLYPENRIFPDLRREDTIPYKMSVLFKTNFLKALRLLAPSEPDDTWIKNNLATLTGQEKDFFAPVAIGVMLERARKYAQALDWYNKVYDTRLQPSARAKVGVLIDERGKNQAPRIQYDDRWTLQSDPHTNARRRTEDEQQTRFGNPYTRFILARITTCLVGFADVEFARGTDESRARALDLYLEAKQILGFDELVDFQASNASEAYLPNPVFVALREHVASALRKLRRGLTYVGTPFLPDLSRSSNGISNLTRPTPYRFRVLMERSKQLVAIAQNLEAQYLSALEKRDGEEEKVRREEATANIAGESVSLRELQQSEARDSVTLAQEQQDRSQLLRNRYAGWIAAGPNEFERTQIESLNIARNYRQMVNFQDTTVAALKAAAESTSLWDAITSFGIKNIAAGVESGIAISRGIQQGIVIGQETEAQISSILASQERRKEEWQLQRDLAGQDILIAEQQIALANDRVKIANQEYRISTIQRDQALDMLKFLSTKFTSVEFYEWQSGVLGEVYAFLLRTASTVALQAEGQLAFIRQQTLIGLIKQDYGNYSSQNGSTSSSTPDRRGITGSALLLKDITALDQYAFDTERRLLNLSQTFSLSLLFPLEFEEFRQTGLLSFATTLRMFDEGFPGHYLRMIKRVRLSVAALIPPNQGIRATLSTSGLSRVVTGDPSFPTLVIRQEPQSVALTSPIAATGVFELDMQSELLNPFEDMGVDTNWYFELPPAGNPFSYDTLFDVLISVEYTALSSIELRDRVVKQLPAELSGDRAFSVRRDLADVWYDLANNSGSTVTIPLSISRSDFPLQLNEISLRQIAFTVRRKDGKPCDFKVKPMVQLSSNQPIEAQEANAINGIASSRQSGAATWSNLITQGGIVDQQGKTWNFALSDVGGQSDSVLALLRNGEVEDILIAFTFSGMKPSWT
jgi:Tc toxin complex TcA C-terminal TcB-binding domain/Concanavalin A-like lectin/glucanases superfamily